MKNRSTLLFGTFILLLFASTQLCAQFDSIPFHSSKKSKDRAPMFELDLGFGYMKDEFYLNNANDPNNFNYSTRRHVYYRVQAGAYWPLVKIGKTGSFGPTIGAGVGFTRRRLYNINLPIGAMIRFGNNSTATTKKAWGYGIGIAIAPTMYFEREYPYGGTGLKEPMLCAELSTSKFALRLDVLPFPMEVRSSTNSKIIFNSDVNLTLAFNFGDLDF